MNTAFKIALVILAIASSGAAISYPHIVWLGTIKSSEFQKLPNKVFVDPSLNGSEQSRAVLMLDKGKERIQQVFGSYSANPTVVITGTPENARKYGLGSVPGTAFAAPWEEYLVIDFQAEDIDVIAHELMHAQMRESLGFWAYLTSIPTWFDEGVAMQVDFRPHYDLSPDSPSESDIDWVKTLSSPSDFWTDDRNQNKANYRAAKAAVHQILQQHPADTAYSMLSKIRKGEDFEDVFGE